MRYFLLFLFLSVPAVVVDFCTDRELIQALVETGTPINEAIRFVVNQGGSK
jgi:hypothetical protein